MRAGLVDMELEEIHGKVIPSLFKFEWRDDFFHMDPLQFPIHQISSAGAGLPTSKHISSSTTHIS
jgi:hypothetical protein